MSQFIANSFQIPNAFVDEALDKVSGNACKIYLLIVRKTRGWNKEADRISFAQIREATGIGSNTTVDNAINELIKFNLIKVISGNQKSSNQYRLNDDFSITKTVKAVTETVKDNDKKTITETVTPITENVKAFTETVTEPFTETVNTENKYKTTREKTSEKRSHDFSNQIPKNQNSQNQILENQKPTVDEVFEFLKNSQVIPVFGDYQANVAELGATIEEVYAFWSNKNFDKQQLLAKILSSLIKRCGGASRIFELVAVENKPQEKPLNAVQFVSPFDIAKAKKGA